MKKFYKKFVKNIGIVFLMALMFGVLSSADAYGADLNNYVPKKDYSANLIANYKFEETSGTTCVDSKGSYNGTYNGTTSRTDSDGTYRTFNGTSDYVGVTNKVTPIGKKSIKFRIKINGDTTNDHIILSNRNWEASNGLDIAVMGYTRSASVKGKIMFILLESTTPILSVTSNKKIDDGQWHTVVFTWDGTTSIDGVRVYIDNLIIPDVMATATKVETLVPTYNLRIGCFANILAGYLKGNLEDIEMYNEVVEYEVKSTGISLNKTSTDIVTGKTETLIPTITLEDATNKTVKWISSHPEIATVDSTGKVTAVTTGSAIITATTTDGSNLSATCTVNVISPYGNRAVLTITMTNGQTKEYDLSMSEVDNFIQWYNNNNTLQSYKFVKNYNIKPFKSRVEYIAHIAVSSFEVNEYIE